MEREPQSAGHLKPPLLCRFELKRAALPAIGEVNHKSESEPYKETDPVHDGQARHEENAGKDGQDRSQRPAGSAEGAMAVGLAIAEDQHACRNQRKGKKSADVGKIGEGPDVEQTGRNSHHKAGDPGGKIGSQIAAVNAAEDFWEEAVAGHGEPDARLADLKNEQGTDHA